MISNPKFRQIMFTNEHTEVWGVPIARPEVIGAAASGSMGLAFFHKKGVGIHMQLIWWYICVVAAFIGLGFVSNAHLFADRTELNIFDNATRVTTLGIAGIERNELPEILRREKAKPRVGPSGNVGNEEVESSNVFFMPANSEQPQENIHKGIMTCANLLHILHSRLLTRDCM
jgi:hypothetical protein